MIPAELKREARAALGAIVRFWLEHTIDGENGGFYGRIDNQNRIDTTADKGAVLNARILWSFSAAYCHENDRSCLDMAKRAYDYITTYFNDRVFGGVFWTVDCTGKPAATKKQVYAQAFVIYACSEYVKASQDPSAKDVAIRLYELIERYSWDATYGGYMEAFSRNWQPAGDLRLSDKDANEPKTMNTHLHVLEAYANLYTIWPDAALRSRIRDLLFIFRDKIIDSSTGHLHLFFTDDWKVREDAISYGHDIEASWLLLEAAEIIRDEDLIKEYQATAIKMAQATLPGMDKDGGLWYELHPVTNQTIKEKHWWVQAEAVVGFLSAWQVSGDEQYLQQAAACWTFIQQYILDKKGGEWFWGVHDNHKVMNEDKIGLWKCPYHNSRACLEIIKRLSSDLPKEILLTLTGTPLYSAVDNIHKNRMAVSRVKMTQADIKCPSAFKNMVPAHRVNAAHFSARIAFFIYHNRIMQRILQGAKIIDFVHPCQGIRKGSRCIKPLINLCIKSSLRFGVAVKISTDQLVVPRPVIFSGGGRMNAQEAPAVVNIILKGLLLKSIEHITPGTQKNNDLVAL